MARILLCDDSRTILMLLEKKLRAAGHEIVGKGKDGDEGIALYTDKKPDLMILDITMPNKDGRECLQGVLKQDPSAKVIMISAVNEAEVIASCLKGGAKAFVSKEKIYKEEEFKRDILAVIDATLKAA